MPAAVNISYCRRFISIKTELLNCVLIRTDLSQNVTWLVPGNFTKYGKLENAKWCFLFFLFFYSNMNLSPIFSVFWLSFNLEQNERNLLYSLYVDWREVKRAEAREAADSGDNFL